MNKRGGWVLVVSIVFVVVLIVVSFLYFALFKPGSSRSSGQSTTHLVNPVSGLSTEEAVAKFNESFVYYFLVSMKAYNLHNSPLSSNKPRIDFVFSDESYNAVIDKGRIMVSKGDIENPDIVISTTKDEAVKILQDSNYIKESFSSGRSSIDLKASKATLFAKGYLSLYQELTGKSITGNIVRIYTG